MKRITYKYLFLIGISLMINHAFSQSVGFTKYNFPNNRNELSTAMGHIKSGDKYYDEGPGMYRLAIDEYLKANKFNPDNALLNYKIGRCYLNYNDKSQAIKYLEKAISLDARISLDMKYNDVNYLLARAYHLDYQFDKAIEKYLAHKNSLSPEQLAKENETIDKRINECEMAKEMVANPIRVFVDNLGETVNSAYPDLRLLAGGNTFQAACSPITTWQPWWTQAMSGFVSAQASGKTDMAVRISIIAKEMQKTGGRSLLVWEQQ